MFDHQMVVKFLDGPVIKGFGEFISPGEMVLEIQDLHNEIHFVDLARVKAVFYVYSFEGMKTDHFHEKKRETKTFASGEKVRITFVDGEEIIGVMTNPETAKGKKGFYITPTEEGSNNYRVYANGAAVNGVYIRRGNREINLLTLPDNNL